MPRKPIKKQIIIEKAIQLFATKGLAQTTTKDIAREASVGEGALYRHWKGKYEMCWALFEEEAAKIAEGTRESLLSEGSFEERLFRGVRFMYEYYMAYPYRTVFVLLGQYGFGEDQTLMKMEIPLEKNPIEQMRLFVDEHIELGDISFQDTIFAVGLLMGIVLQPIYLHRIGRTTKAPLSYVREIVHAVKSALSPAGFSSL